ncbi:hypothetical protein [Demequina aurantiaca]|uniref:hypothetical protein n=1 Tax=Demequina aurantiaca TaxID=676200 RepID=UPI003D329F31
MTLPPEPKDGLEQPPPVSSPGIAARPGIDAPDERPAPGIDEHAWISKPATPEAKAHSRAGRWVLVGLVLVLVLLVFVLSKIAVDVANRIELPNFTTTSEPADAAGSTAGSDGEAASDESVSTGQVDYLIGSDLDAGVYRLAETYVGADRWDSCSWALYSDGVIGDDNRVSGDVYTGGRGAVTVSDGQLWSTYACGAWVEVDPAGLFLNPDAAAETFGNGGWLVGEDIRPGTYTMVNEFDPGDENDFCFYSVSDRWLGESDLVYAAEFADYPAQYTTQLETGVMVNSDNCGEWVRTGD